MTLSKAVKIPLTWSIITDHTKIDLIEQTLEVEQLFKAWIPVNVICSRPGSLYCVLSYMRLFLIRTVKIHGLKIRAYNFFLLQILY
jgi:hypothetical protein